MASTSFAEVSSWIASSFSSTSGLQPSGTIPIQPAELATRRFISSSNQAKLGVNPVPKMAHKDSLTGPSGVSTSVLDIFSTRALPVGNNASSPLGFFAAACTMDSSAPTAAHSLGR